jgi:hypothetical protein
MGVAAPGLSSSELIASIVTQEGNLYAAARVHERRLDAAATVTPCTTSLALTVVSMRSLDSSSRETLALQLHHAFESVWDARLSQQAQDRNGPTPAVTVTQ